MYVRQMSDNGKIAFPFLSVSLYCSPFASSACLHDMCGGVWMWTHVCIYVKNEIPGYGLHVMWIPQLYTESSSLTWQLIYYSSLRHVTRFTQPMFCILITSTVRSLYSASLPSLFPIIMTREIDGFSSATITNFLALLLLLQMSMYSGLICTDWTHIFVLIHMIIDSALNKYMRNSS